MKTETVDKMLTTLCISAWLKCSSAHVENVKTQTWVWCIVCVHPEYIVLGGVTRKVRLMGKDEGNGFDAEVL